jgi:methyl-accepting chemotaxis protein
LISGFDREEHKLMGHGLTTSTAQVVVLRARNSIQVRVLVASFVLSLAGLFFAGNSLRDALVERSNAQALDVTSGTLATLSHITIDLSLERSLSQVSIEVPGAIEPKQCDVIATLRRKLAVGLQELLRQANGVTTTALGAAFNTAIIELRDRLTPLREKFDQLNMVPGAERPAEIVESLPREMKAIVVSFQAQRHLLRGPGLMLPTEVSILETIRDQAWQIREFGGRERTYIAIAAANAAPITPARLEEMGVLARRAGDAWLDITRLALHEGLPEKLRTAVHAVEQGYYGRYEQLRTAMIAEAHKADPAYPADFERFFSESSEALGGTEALSFVASEAIEDYRAERARATLNIVIVDASAALVLIAVGIGYAWMTVRAFLRLYTLLERMRTLAEGDMTTEIPHSEMRDEVGEMARTVMVFRATAQQRVKLEETAALERAEKDRLQATAGRHTKALTDSLAEIMRGLSVAAKRMDAASGQMAEAAGCTGDLARVTTERAKSSAADLATVAHATAQLTGSANEISEQVTRAAATSGGMAANANITERTMTGLSDAAAQVSDVAKLIGDIASQTNLLALNATIEAARAGDAGRGFAVVASEVKQLASRTAAATAEIASQIGSIQAATRDAVVAVRRMSAEVRQMEEMGVAITTAVEQQGTGIYDISISIASVIQATEEAVRAMGEALVSAEETRATSGEVRDVAADVGRESNRLGRELHQFLQAIREETDAPVVEVRNHEVESNGSGMPGRSVETGQSGSVSRRAILSQVG